MCNREVEVVGVAEERKCKRSVCVTGRLKVWQERGSVRCVFVCNREVKICRCGRREEV